MSILNYIEKMKEMYEGERITAQGPRTGFKEGNGVYDEKELLGKRVRELMDEGYDFGEAVRQAMKEGYADGGRIGFRYGSSSFDAHTKREAAFKAYKDYKKSYYNSRQRNPIITFREFLPIYAKENFAEGGRIGLKPGGIVEPGVEYYGKFTEAEKKANIKTWMDNTGSTLEDYSKLPSSTQNNIRFARITGIKQTPEYGKKKEGAATKQFRNWLNKQDPKTLTADSVDDLIKQSKIKTTSTGQRSGLVNAINRIMEEKEFAKFKNIQLGRVYSQENINQLSDDLLKAYAEDDIRLVMDPKHKTSISDIRTNRRGSLDKAIKNTGLDEETIFNLLDDREAYVELEYKKATTKGRPVEKGKAKFYKQAENWIVKNSKRYADPDKFKKAFVRTFGKDNHLIQTINKGISRGITRSMTSTPFSDWFRLNILGTSEQAMRGQVKPSYSSTQLDNIFKTAIYTNNENVRNKIINELTDILPEKGSKRIPDIRDKFRNSPILKKFGLNQKIDGPIARLLAKEVGDDLLKQVSLFRKPWLGTPELITYLKDRVNPKYKSMFEEASKAILYAQKKQWPEAKKALNISESIMFDHKIPKALMQLGYADDIEYIKVNPTSAEFNARIKNTQFDKPMIKLANQWEKAKTVDAKSKIVGEMNTLKDTFSKKYGNYLDDVKINVDKTGKPVFSSEAPVVTKKTDLVKSLKASLQQERKGITSPPKNIKGAISVELLDDMFKAGKITVGTSKGIMQAARKIGAEFEIAFLLGEFFNNVSKGQDKDLAWANAKQSATMGFWKGGDRKYFEKLKELAKEEGIDSKTFEKVYEINKREHLATTMGMTGKLSPVAQIKTLEDQLKELKSIPKIFQDKKIIAAKENLLNIKKGQLEKYKKETWDKESELIFDIRKNKAGYGHSVHPNLQKIAETPVYEEEYSDAFKNLGNIAVKYLDREKKKAYNPKKPWVPKKIKRALGIPAGQSEQLYPDQGAWGNWFSTNIFTLDARGKAKEQARILDMVKRGGPGELYRYNLARDNVPGVSWESYKDLIEKYPGLGLRTEEASGGRAGYMGGGIAAIRKPHAIPPERQGLRSIMINGKKS